MRGWWRKREPGDWSRHQANQESDITAMQPKQSVYFFLWKKKKKKEKMYPSKWPATGNLIIISYWDKRASDGPLHLSLHAQASHYVPVCARQTGHHNTVWQSCESRQTSMTHLGLYGSLLSGVHHFVWEFAENSSGENISKKKMNSSFWERTEKSSIIDLAERLGSKRLIRVKSASHRQLNGVLRRPIETTESSKWGRVSERSRTSSSEVTWGDFMSSSTWI